MSPELETLDQLLGGDLSAAVVLGLYADAAAFRRGAGALLKCGDVALLCDGIEIPAWQWPALLSGDLAGLRFRLTPQGARRVA
jgi:hypothetical protein